ncbi:maleylpyruvate isomerase family mycothiol-dependent enzyme [Nocardiopsis potens]|uniref:maleylpyruvate isomerase family mycothiol-dependent enzyme n=1 Tax=Nocardiopsis potens TaxID=1246458 RepID=UPI0003457767|nr:maleylpyruvate isomerase family mycothiol-dependent enzyme [Nocardiopsis potens]
MDIADHIDVLTAQGHMLADAARRAGPGAPVPYCPDWTVRDLLAHTGSVHRWARAQLRAGAGDEPLTPERRRGVFPVPEDPDLTGWYLDGHGALVEALAHYAEHRPDLEAFTFLPGAPSALAFWARRQAHETAVHRVDAELAAGVPLSPLAPTFAADGVDELLNGFLSRPGRGASPVPRSIAVQATDADCAHRVELAPDGMRAAPGTGPTDVRLTAPAHDLYLILWNRAEPRPGQLDGDADALKTWREAARI